VFWYLYEIHLWHPKIPYRKITNYNCTVCILNVLLLASNTVTMAIIGSDLPHRLLSSDTSLIHGIHTVIWIRMKPLCSTWWLWLRRRMRLVGRVPFFLGFLRPRHQHKHITGNVIMARKEFGRWRYNCYGNGRYHDVHNKLQITTTGDSKDEAWNTVAMKLKVEPTKLPLSRHAYPAISKNTLVFNHSYHEVS